MIDLVSTIIQPVTVAYVSYSDITKTELFISHHPVDRISVVSRHRKGQRYPLAVTDHDCGCLWYSSIGLRLETEVGYGWLDVLLHPRNPGFLFLPATLLILENGRLLLGTDSCESGKKLIVHVSVALVSCSDKGLNMLFRMKETLILVPYRSSLGMIMSVFWYITFL